MRDELLCLRFLAFFSSRRLSSSDKLLLISRFLQVKDAEVDDDDEVEEEEPETLLVSITFLRLSNGIISIPPVFLLDPAIDVKVGALLPD